MKVKLFTAFSETRLEHKVNTFLSDPSIEITDMQYTSNFFSYSLLISFHMK